MRDAGLWAATMGIQSGSDRIRRDYYERETSDDEIVHACEIFDRHGVIRNLDFIGDNPYENDDDRRATVNLLARLPTRLRSAAAVKARFTYMVTGKMSLPGGS